MKQWNETEQQEQESRAGKQVIAYGMKETNKEAEKTCLNTYFIFTQQCKNDSWSDSLFEYESLMETNGNRQKWLQISSQLIRKLTA